MWVPALANSNIHSRIHSQLFRGSCSLRSVHSLSLLFKKRDKILAFKELENYQWKGNRKNNLESVHPRLMNWYQISVINGCLLESMVSLCDIGAHYLASWWGGIGWNNGKLNGYRWSVFERHLPPSMWNVFVFLWLCLPHCLAGCFVAGCTRISNTACSPWTTACCEIG